MAAGGEISQFLWRLRFLAAASWGLAISLGLLVLSASPTFLHKEQDLQCRTSLSKHSSLQIELQGVSFHFSHGSSCYSGELDRPATGDG